jgi:sulfate adenylyltransferase large subunit
MTARPEPGAFAPEGFLDHQERKGLLRFIVCGSVDHGKSTLIGRLLYEAGLLFVDQLDALDHDSRHHGMLGEERDFSLVLDGLAAEREQRITIDVAYRFFSTARRKFIVADAPGHEQYTRNMATAASTADIALLLVSADTGLTRQTRRHALIVSTLGVRRFVIAVNKMDLVGWSRSKFCALKAEFRAFAKDIEVDDIVFIPVAARTGDNIIARPRHMTWYRGPTLLEHLEKLEVAPRGRPTAFRMPVQCVIRPDPNFRGYGGLIGGGSVRPGMPVQILPSGQRTHISRIVTADGDLALAIAGQAVTLTFMDEVDASRGDVIAEVGRPAPVTKRFAARLVWTGHDALIPGRAYLLKLAASTVYATIERPFLVVDLDTHRYAAADGIRTNDIASITVQLDRPLALDRYVSNKDTGSFILIDPETDDTVAMGIVEATHADGNRSVVLPKTTTFTDLIRATETHGRSLTKAVSWRAAGSLDTFVVAILITGSSRVAGSVALAEILTKTLIYYLHERAWAAIRWGKR